ncbi:cytochrome c biogenesis CcdA family protein [Pararhodobacter aggregans]|uniref:Cytochrome C biogenesis protein n=1 Tax=Pararhodobacter aggregans TaxID=404875 RepID=A0A2T7UR07_9RHOB|nr:cytochrome c biogenesis protein CcdA [Pararhodobacter aggregans]PTX01931.1 cytochrome c-type biogenesis protein [Pararhodobacter aggregans]PVE47117.1 cytochrome C biogenesis protein [Pararhodobacter aggregans]
MFGIDLFDAALMPSLFVALLAGLLSFLSPCVLPIVPPYLAYMSGISMRELTESRGLSPATVPALFFVMGLSTVFLFLGFTASSLGRLFLAYRQEFAMAAGVVVIVMGLHFLGLFRLGFLMREARFEGGKGGSAFGAYVLGLAFAFGWTPCIGPILGTIITLAAAEDSVAQGTALLAAYAVGLGLPFLLAAIFITRSMRLMNRLKPWMGWIEKAMGVLLVVVGVALITGWMADFSFWLLEVFPALGRIG